jgi:hypothetical protein
MTTAATITTRAARSKRYGPRSCGFPRRASLREMSLSSFAISSWKGDQFDSGLDMRRASAQREIVLRRKSWNQTSDRELT